MAARCPFSNTLLTLPTEEFGIYLNYVRKLGFEETPDYDFLRELFAKVMKNNNDVDDGVYDWNLLNGVASYHFCVHSIIHYSYLSRRSRVGDCCGMYPSRTAYSHLLNLYSRAKIRYSLKSPLLHLRHLPNPIVEGTSNIGIPTVAGHQRSVR
jgi:hypothetical protein